MRVSTELIDIVSNVREGEPDVGPSLVSSVTQYGLLQPIVVLDTGDGRYRILDGHRRFAAVNEAGMDEVDITIRESDLGNGEIIGAQVHANQQREDMTAWQLAQAAMDLKEQGSNVKDSAVLLGVTQKEVSAFRKAGSLELTDDRANQLTMTGLLELVEYDDDSRAGFAEDMARVAIDEGRSIRNAQWHVASEWEQAERESELADLLRVWDEAGIKIVKENPSIDTKSDKSYTVYLSRVQTIGDGYQSLDVDLTKHMKEPCHVIHITQQAKPVHYCINKNVHSANGKSELKFKGAVKEAEKKADESADRKANKEAKQVRRVAAIKWLVKPLIAKTKWFPFAIRQAVQGRQWSDDDTRVVVMAMIEAQVMAPRPTGAEYDWYNKQLNTYLDGRFDDAVDQFRWKSQALASVPYIEDRWPNEDIVALIDAVK